MMKNIGESWNGIGGDEKVDKEKRDKL